MRDEKLKDLLWWYRAQAQELARMPEDIKETDEDAFNAQYERVDKAEAAIHEYVATVRSTPIKFNIEEAARIRGIDPKGMDTDALRDAILLHDQELTDDA